MVGIYAHRGAAQAAPENSVGAFLDARRQGADGVELDVRRSADGALVVHHDAAIGGLGAIADLAVSALPVEVPLLAAAMGACEGLVVNVEIKNDPAEPGHDPTDALARQVIDELGELGWLGRVLISSFDLATIEAVRRVDDRVPIGWLLDPRRPAPSGREVAERGFDALHPHHLATDEALVESAREHGLAVNVWTVDDPAEMDRMARLGVDILITDEVPLARQTLGG